MATSPSIWRFLMRRTRSGARVGALLLLLLCAVLWSASYFVHCAVWYNIPHRLHMSYARGGVYVAGLAPPNWRWMSIGSCTIYAEPYDTRPYFNAFNDFEEKVKYVDGYPERRVLGFSIYYLGKNHDHGDLSDEVHWFFRVPLWSPTAIAAFFTWYFWLRRKRLDPSKAFPVSTGCKGKCTDYGTSTSVPPSPP